MLHPLINNIAFLVALVAAGQVILSRFAQPNLSRTLWLGLLFGGVTVLGMMSPVHFQPGVFFDGRSIVLAVAGVVGGAAPAAIAAGIAAAYRYSLGGAGAVVGVVVILQSALLGVLARQWWIRRARTPAAADYLSLGMLVQLAQLAAFTQLPGGAGYAFIAQAGWVLLVFYPFATMLLCLIFRNYEQQHIDQVRLQEAQAEASRERTILRTLFDSLPHLIWLKDSQGKYLACNQRFEQFFGAPEREIVGKTDHDFVPAALADSFRAHDRKAIEQDGPSVNEEEIVFASDGHREHLETTKVPMRDAEGRLIGVLGIGHDISERKRYELALENTAKQLRFVLEGSGLGFWDWDIATGKVERNARWAEMLGYSHAEIQNTVRQWTDFIHPEDRARAWDSIQAVLDGKTNIHRLEYRMLHKDGGVRWILDQASVMQRDADGKPLRMCGTHADITARKEAEARAQENEARYRQQLEQEVEERTRQLVLAKEAAEAANIAKSAFLANMSHELRTPLNAILGFSQLMENDARIPADVRRNIATINRSGKHLLALINDVLEIARIESGRSQVKNGPFRLMDTLTAVQEMMQLRAEAKGLELDVERASGLPEHVLGDGHRLGQVLINLLGNAVKYTDHGRITLRIEREAGEWVRFEVHDTGTGIAPDQLQRIFEPFYQTPEGVAKGEGTGLGLAISREFVRMMGGELEVESALGKGSRFVFSIPLPAVEREAGERPSLQVVGLAAGQAAPRILVAEDHPDNQELIRQLLTQVGCEVRVVGNGQEAVAAFQHEPPQLILMDMRMPVMDGYDATRAIRNLPGGDQVFIVALTASAFEEDRKQVLAAGCDELIRKPIETEQLFRVIAGLLQVRFEYAKAAPAPVPKGSVDLGALPEAIRHELMQRALELDKEALLGLVARIRPQWPEEAKQIAELVDEYRYDRIEALCKGG